LNVAFVQVHPLLEISTKVSYVVNWGVKKTRTSQEPGCYVLFTHFFK